MEWRLNVYLMVLQIRTAMSNLMAWSVDKIGLVASDWISMPPTVATKSITPLWLSKVLQRKVKSVTDGDLGGHTGMVGSLSTVRVEFKDSKDTLSLILKTSNPTNRKRLLHTGPREHLFYQSPFSTSLSVPKVWYSHGRFGEEVILMEDLLAPKTTNKEGGVDRMNDSIGNGGGGGGGCDEKEDENGRNGTAGKAMVVNRILAHQPWLQNSDSPASLSAQKTAVLKAIFLHAANIHSKYWNDKRLLEQRWMRGADWYLGGGRAYWELSMDMARKGWMSLRERDGLQLDERLGTILDRSYRESSWEHLQEHLHDKTVPFTLTHGDFHAGNMILNWQETDLIAKQPGKVNDSSTVEKLSRGLTLVDWAEVGPWEPTSDLAQSVISDIPVTLFEDAKEALKLYWDHLQQRGIENYSWEDCLRRFGPSGMERWIWVVGALGYYGVPVGVVNYFLAQMTAFHQTFCPDHTVFYLKTCIYSLPA